MGVTDMAGATSFDTYLDDVEQRRKRRRLDCGLEDKPVQLAVETSADAAEEQKLATLKGAKLRKAIAYSLQVYEPSLDSFRTDYSSEYARSGRRSINFVLGSQIENRFEEHPKLKKLLDLHTTLVTQHAHPPTHLAADLRTFNLGSLLPVRFDCIVIDPPRQGEEAWTWADLEALPIATIAAHPSFIWIWVGCGSDDGLEKGRALLAKWGYRRCEDITWLKTNRRAANFADEPPAKGLFTNVKEHCLMGIRGTVRRSTDGSYVHCNVDTDIIIAEPDENDPMRKPEELYNIIENFCLGTRRLQLFPHPGFFRPGWLSIGPSAIEGVGIYEYVKETYDAYFDNAANAMGNVVPSTPEIEALRPRTPPPRGQVLQDQSKKQEVNTVATRGRDQAAMPLDQWRPSYPQQQRNQLPVTRGRPQQHIGLAAARAVPPSVRAVPPSVPARPAFAPNQAQTARATEPQAPLDLNALASSMGGWDSLIGGSLAGRKR